MPRPYRYILEAGLAGLQPSTALQPWYFLGDEDLFDIVEKWPVGPCSVHLIAFARRQDCDDIACFDNSLSDDAPVLVIHGWTDSGYDVLEHYPDFWAWFKSVIDDIVELSERIM